MSLIFNILIAIYIEYFKLNTYLLEYAVHGDSWTIDSK